MKKSEGQYVPRARQDGLIVRELPNEVLIYDLDRDQAHCLNQTAALVWKGCDGRTTVAEITRLLAKDLSAPVDEKVVWFALGQLSKNHLLEEQVKLPATVAGISRRDLVRVLGIAVAIPLVTSIIAPLAANAQSPRCSGVCKTSADCNIAAGCFCNTSVGRCALG